MSSRYGAMRSRREQRDSTVKALDLMGQLTLDMMNIVDKDFKDQTESSQKARGEIATKEERPNRDTWWMQREASGKRRERKSQIALIGQLARFVSVRMD